MFVLGLVLLAVSLCGVLHVMHKPPHVQPVWETRSHVERREFVDVARLFEEGAA